MVEIWCYSCSQFGKIDCSMTAKALPRDELLAAHFDWFEAGLSVGKFEINSPQER